MDFIWLVNVPPYNGEQETVIFSHVVNEFEFSQLVGSPKKDRKQSIKAKTNRSLSFHFDLFSGCWFVGLLVCPVFWIFGCSLISHELLDKIYIYACHQNELNDEIKIMRFICRFNVYFSRNQRKCSQNGVDENLKL